MCADPDPEKERLNQQITLAWEHFKFHAEQRTRMFHFFIIISGALLAALGTMSGKDGLLVDYRYIVMTIGGILGTFFLALDIRNTQLLQMSENIIRKIEDESLYKSWTVEVDGEKIKLGILSREEVLKNYLSKEQKNKYRRPFRYIAYNNIKHKLSVRAIIIISIILFFTAANNIVPDAASMCLFLFCISASIVVLIATILSVVWGAYALYSPVRDIGLEKKAFASQQLNGEAEL